MATEQQPNEDSNEPDSSSKTLILTQRAILGAGTGLAVGALAGWIIDAMLTDDPYAGIRIGAFLGAIIGGQIAVGSKLLAYGVLMIMVACSAIGALAPVLIWRPDPDSILLLVTTGIGGVAGAFAGLIIAIGILKWARSRGPNAA